MTLLRAISYVTSDETAHRFALLLLRLAKCIPGMRWLLHKIYAVEHPLLEREVFGLHFRNPIGMAAGFDRNGEVFSSLAALGFGFVEIGTVTPRAQQGNPRPRVFTLDDDKAILNRIGLASKGLEKVIANLRHSKRDIVIGCNIGKNSITPPENASLDYLRVFRNLYQYVDYFSVNVSCNTTFRHYSPTSREAIYEILNPLFDFRRGQSEYRPILLKISPDLTNEEVDLMTDIMLDTPLDGIVATNATTRSEGLITDGETLAEVGQGAISGQPLTKRAVEVVARIYERSHGTYPIIGVGGLMSPADVKAMLNAGATLVQVYTGYVYNGARFVSDICRALRDEQLSRTKI